jgi:hypothetical protein
MEVFDTPALVVLPIVDLDLVVAAATHHDAVNSMVFVSVSDLSTKDAVLHRLAEACEAPDYVRPNWDSFDEWLRDLSWMPSGGRVIVLAGTDHYRMSDPGGWEHLLAIASDAVAMHGSGPTPLWFITVGRP